MKNGMLIIIAFLLMFAVGCEQPCDTPDPIIVKDTITVIDTVYIDTTVVPEFIVPTLNLQPVEANLAKSLIEQYPGGVRMYEIEASMLSKASAGTIAFGDVNATKEYFYILVNNGSADIRNVAFNTELVVAAPEFISVVESSGAGIGLISILKIAIPHLIPIDGAGALLPFDIGTFIDTVHTTYEYTNLLTSDTVQSFQDWEVTGNRLGATFDILINGFSVLDPESNYNLRLCGPRSEESPDADFLVQLGNVPNVSESNLEIVNAGNVPLSVGVRNHTQYELTNNPIVTVYTVPVSDTLSLTELGHVQSSDGTRIESKFLTIYSLTSAIMFHEAVGNGVLEERVQMDGDMHVSILYEESP